MSKAKGDRMERIVVAELELRGFWAERSIHTRNHQDFFHAADIMAFHPELKIFAFIGVTDWHNRSRTLGKLANLPLPPTVSKWAVIYKQEKGKLAWHLFEYDYKKGLWTQNEW